MKVQIMRSGSGPPCSDCGRADVTRVADATGTLCLACVDQHSGAGDPPDLFLVDHECPCCHKRLSDLRLPLWRQLYEQNDVCLDCRRGDTPTYTFLADGREVEVRNQVLALLDAGRQRVATVSGIPPAVAARLRAGWVPQDWMELKAEATSNGW